MNEDYELLDVHHTYIDKDDIAKIKILTGEYEGTEFTFGTVKVNENEDTQECTISFDYRVHNNELLEQDKNFELVLEQIMNNILMQSIEEAEKEYERRKKDTETPD